MTAPAPAPVSPYLTDVEAAAYLHVSVRTLARWRVTGKGGPRYRKHARHVLYTASDLDAWSASQSRLSSSDVLLDAKGKPVNVAVPA